MRPLILDFIEKRIEENSIINYEYDNSLSMNVIISNGEKKAFIDFQIADIELVTKTRAQRENDDNHSNSEIITSTKVSRERDDLTNSFLEVSTKTFTKRERED